MEDGVGIFHSAGSSLTSAANMSFEATFRCLAMQNEDLIFDTYNKYLIGSR